MCSGVNKLMNSISVISDFLAPIVCGGIDSLRYCLSFKLSKKFKLKEAFGG